MSTEIFNAIAPRYDATNYALSLGMDIGWRRRITDHLPVGDSLAALDLATGTADVALVLARHPRVGRVVGIDVATGMLDLARAKVRKAGFERKIELAAGDALALDFPDESFDVLTVAFGIRNFSDLMRGLAEAYRVLKPGGCFIVLEFSTPRGFVQRAVHGFYLKHMVPFIGMLLTGRKEAYAYLSRTVKAFPYGDRFSRIIRQAGFGHVERVELAMGTATIYVAKK